MASHSVLSCYTWKPRTWLLDPSCSTLRIRKQKFSGLESGAVPVTEYHQMVTLINPVPRAEPFDHGDWLFELKFDGFRAAGDTVRGRLVSRNGDRLRRFEGVLDQLPRGHVFDGELGPLWPYHEYVGDDDGRS